MTETRTANNTKEWVLMRLSDDGLWLYRNRNSLDLGTDLMGMTIDGQPAAIEIARDNRRDKIDTVFGQLSDDEKARTLLRCVVAGEMPLS